MIMITVVSEKKAGQDGQPSTWSGIQNMEDLTNHMVMPSTKRTQGTHESQGVLVRAGPGTGKTVSLQQLTRLIAQRLYASSSTEQGIGLVPMLLTVQRLASYLRKGALLIDAPDLLRAFIEIEYTGPDQDLLLQAYDMRALVCSIDGVDEAAGLKTRIEDLLIEKLAPMGIRTVASSRPEGVRLERYSKFQVMDLAPLSEEQQRAAIAFQLKNSKEYDHLVILSKLRKEMRTKDSTAEQITAALESNSSESYGKIAAVVTASKPGVDVRAEVGRVLEFFELASTVPVMLSMLVLCLEDIATNKTGTPVPLPTSRLDLYTTAVRAAIRRRFAGDEARASACTLMLGRLSVINHSTQRREFTSVDVASALADVPSELELWSELEGSTEGVPLIKILEVGSTGASGSAKDEELSKYQFKHLSFQEAFFADGLTFKPDSSHGLLPKVLAQQAQAVWKRGALRVLNDRWMLNTFTICGGILGPSVSEQLGNTLTELYLTEHQVKVMTSLAWEPLRGQSSLKTLVMKIGVGIDFSNKKSPGVEKFAAMLADPAEMAALTHLDFGKPVNIGQEAAAIICSAVEKRRGLTLYGSIASAQFRGISNADAILIAATLRNSIGHSLDVSDARIVLPTEGAPYIGLASGKLAEALKSAGASGSSFPRNLASHMVLAGFSAADLRAAKYSTADLANLGYSASDILSTIGNGQVSPAALRELTEHGLALEIVAGPGPIKVSLEDLLNAQCPGVPSEDAMDDAVDKAANMPSLKTLKDVTGTINASKDQISDKDGAAIIWAIALNCNAPTELNLSRNSMGPLTCDALAQFLRFNTSIVSIDLHDNAIDDAGAASLTKALSTNNTLATLRVSMNKIQIPGAVSIFEGLDSNFSLELLVMESTGGTSVAGIPIPQLKGLKPNELIDLSSRRFGPLSATVIARLIQSYRPQLIELGIDRNPLKAEGTAAIAEMLKTNDDIKELDVRFCGLGPEGAIVLANALRVNTSVERVLMLQNQVGDVGAKAFIDMLPHNNSLHLLSFQDNQLNNASKAALEEAGRKRGNITILQQ